MTKYKKHLEYIDKNPLLKKSFDFSLEIIKICKEIRLQHREYSIADQLLRSGTSIGANANEAVISFSRKDFISKMNISLKEAYESRYWLLLIVKSGYLENAEKILEEIDELIRILVKIVKTARENEKKSQIFKVK
jgi:four helix bundle protein